MIEQKGKRHYVRIMHRGERIPMGGCATREEAEELEAAGYLKARENPMLTLGEWGKDWLDQRERDYLRAMRSDRGRWRHISESDLASLPIAMIGVDDVSKWITSLRSKKTATPFREPEPIAPKTIREAVQLLAKSFDDAMLARHVTGNPVRIAWKQHRAALGRVEQKRRAVQEPWTYLTDKQQRDLLTHSDIPEPHRLIMAFAIFTGLREGEQFNLELRDVQVNGDEPHIFIRWGAAGEPPKNGKTRRVLLSQDALAVTNRWLEVLPRWLDENKNEHGLVFPTVTGCRVQRGKTPLHKSVQIGSGKTAKTGKIDLFKQYIELIGIDHRVRWHDLRHTCASSLVSGLWGRRWSLEEVQAYMGHESRQSTERYAHLAEGTVQRALESTSIRHSVLPNQGKEKVQRSSASMRNNRVGRQGLEPWTYGLKAPSLDEYMRIDADDFGTRFGTRAIEVLRAITRRGAGVAELCETFAHDLVLDTSIEPVLAARAAQVWMAFDDRDPLAFDRAIDLAERVLAIMDDAALTRAG